MNRLERRTLKFYQHFHGRPMSVAAMVRFNVRVYLLLALLFGVVAALEWYFVNWIAGCATAGVFCLVVLRDIGHFRRTKAVWPMLDGLMDWAKVDALAASEDAANPPGQ